MADTSVHQHSGENGHSHDRHHSGHGHHHHHDNTFLVSKNKSDAGVRITRLGLYTNVGMAVTKGIGGYVFNSQALIADALHAVTDLVSDILTLATVSWALKPPTERYPNGFGKIESLGSLGVSSLLFFGGIAMGWSSLISILQVVDLSFLHLPFDLHELAHGDHGHGHGHGHGGHGHSHGLASDIPSLNAIYLALGSIIIKEYLYRATMKIAVARGSSVLASNAVHHRIDSLTSIVALVAIAGSNVLKGAAWLDPTGGLLVSAMVVRAGWQNSMSALRELADVGISNEAKEKISAAGNKALATASASYKIIDVSGIKSGQNLLVDVAVEVPKGTTVGPELEAAEETIRNTVGAQVRGARRVRVRWVQAGSPLADEFVPEDAFDEAHHDQHEHEHHDHHGKKE